MRDLDPITPVLIRSTPIAYRFVNKYDFIQLNMHRIT